MKLTTQVYKSEIFSHPPLTGTPSVTYFITHNKGRMPNSVKLFADYNGDGVYVEYPDWVVGANWNGYYMQPTSTLNQLVINVHRVYELNTNIYFEFHYF